MNDPSDNPATEAVPLASLEPEDAAAIRPPSLIGYDGSLGLAVAGSLVLHLLFVVIAYSVKVPEVSIDIDVRESRGVALMSQIGFAPPTEDDGEEEEFVEVEEVPEEGDDTESESDGAEASGGGPDDEPAEQPIEEPAEEESEEEPGDAEEPVALDPDVVAEIQTPPRIERPEFVRPPTPEREEPQAEREPSEGTGTGAGSGEGDEEEVDPADLPPARRYPEGTVNPVATDVGMWGPEGAASVAVVRNDRIRASRHRDAVETIFGLLGDYGDLSDRTSIDIIDDVDTMLLASTDVSNSSRTFIAAVHRLDPTYLMAELRRGYPSGVNWEERSGRYFGTPGAFNTLPRRFVIPTDRLLIYTRPEFIDPLLSDAPRPRGLEGAIDGIENRMEAPPTLDEILVELGLPAEAPEEYSADGRCDDRSGIARRRCQDRQDENRREARRAIDAWEAQRAELLPQAEAELERREEAFEQQRFNGRRNRADREPPVRADESWINGLLEVGDLAGAGDDGPSIVWTFNGFESFGLGGLRAGTRPPRSLHASLTLDRDPILALRFVFENEEAAEDFRDQWGAVCAHYTFPLNAAGLYRAFNGADWEIDHNEAVATITVPASSMNRLATAVGMMGGR